MKFTATQNIHGLHGTNYEVGAAVEAEPSTVRDYVDQQYGGNAEDGHGCLEPAVIRELQAELQQKTADFVVQMRNAMTSGKSPAVTR